MIIKTRLIKFSGILLMIIATLVTALAFFFPYLFDVNAYRDEIVSSLQKSLNRPVSFSSGSFAWHFGPSFEFNRFLVKERDGRGDFLSADQITVQLALLPLLEGNVELKNLRLNGARISLVRAADGSLNIDDLLKPGTSSTPIQLDQVRILKSIVQWRDLAQQKPGLEVALHIQALSIDHPARGKKGHFKLSAEIPAVNGPASSITFSGDMRLPVTGRPLQETELDCNADIRQVEIGKYWPYFGRFIPFPNTGGRLTIATSFKGKAAEFSAKGTVRVNSPAVQWPTVFHAVLAPRSIQLDYTLKLTRQLFEISSLDATIDGFRVKGSFQLQDYSSKDPRIIAKATTPGTFRYEDVRSYVPYRIIEKDASDYIENKIKSGIFKLESGILDGRISQISHMEIGTNGNTLTINGQVDKGVLSYGPKVPSFTSIKGGIELKGKNFSLTGMSGNFGTSPFTMNGSITEYNTDRPSEYPFTMNISPNPPEIAWISKVAGMSRLEYGNSSSLKLSGNGYYAAYRLNGDWDLKSSSYSYPDMVRKPATMPSHVTFSSIIGKEETKVTSITCTLQALTLTGSGLIGYGSQPYLGFDLTSNSFQMSESLPILTLWQQYKLRGTAQAHIKAGGNPEDMRAMNYTGTVHLNGVSFLPDESLKSVSNIAGTVVFKGSGLESTNITGRYGSSPIAARIKIRNFRDIEQELTVSAPEFYLRDINLAKSRPDANIRRFNAAGTIRGDTYTFKSISGLINSSNFNISGVYQSGRAPEATLSITSTKLDIDELLMLMSPGKSDSKTGTSGIDLKLNLQVESGNYGTLLFSRLKAALQQENGTVYLQSLSAGIYGGKLNAKGRIASGGEQGSRYDLSIDLDKVDADKLFPALDISREITGSLTLHGDLTARGNSLIDIKKTALGNISLQLNSGKLRKFNTLSKVFSILNVSQLLKFQLPDMVSGGMPYNEITGSFAVKDGSLSSQNLFINSDAINISVVGSADIVKEELNFTLGVQPLQTVDKVVNRIPIVGWLLTGKDKSFLTAYFEAKGKWSDPQVSAIPVKSMGKGVLNIFRRAFELPVRLFTDTGEVILGQ